MSNGPNFILDKRHAVRYGLNEDAVLYNTRYYRLTVTLSNVSTGGLQVVDEMLDPGSHVLIEWNDRKFEGTVKWSENMVSGIELHHEISVSHPLMQTALETHMSA